MGAGRALEGGGSGWAGGSEAPGVGRPGVRRRRHWAGLYRRAEGLER